jgi:protein phosphatase
MRTYELEQAGLTDIGNVRAINEDHLLAEGDLFVVADGMGGQGRGEVASRLAVEQIHAAFANDPSEAGLVAAVKLANTAVFEHPDTGESEQKMGTTVAAAALVVDGEHEYLSVVNVGDSRVYHLRAGQLTRLSMDHSQVADLVRSGELSDDEAAVHPERHILTMAVGVSPEVEPFVARTKPQSGDRLLLCSDGLFNELSGSEIAETLSNVDNAEQAATQLVALAKEHGGNDNITAMVIDIS